MEKKNTILYHPLSEEGKERWLFASGLDDMKTSGCYVVRLRHGAAGYGLPLENCGNSHYVVATLFVTDSGSDERLQVNRVLGQTIILPSCNDATTRIFSRTLSKRNSTSKWSKWDSVASQSELEQHIKSQADIEVAWGASSHINTLIAPGVYNIKGERLNANDGLPRANSSPGHTIAAKLLVLDSSISGTGDSQDKCVTQILMLSNRTGSDGNVYMRTGSAASKNTLNGGYGWSSWGKLQQNVEVGQVTSLNNHKDNGIYSGVYTDGTSFFETFVMVAINNYAVAGAAGKVRSISQFKYALGVDGSFSYKTRVGQGNTGISWGEWTDIDKNALHAVEEEKARAQKAEAELQAGISSLVAGTVPDGAITAEKLSAEVRDKVDNPLRSLYIAAGAKYNDTGADIIQTTEWNEDVTHKAGHYYLNGIGNITETEMRYIYNAGRFTLSDTYRASAFDPAIRTIMPARGGYTQSYITTSLNCSFYGCTKLEIIRFTLGVEEYTLSVNDLTRTFSGLSKLRQVRQIMTIGNIKSVEKVELAFAGCSSLEEVRLKYLKVSISISDSPFFSKASVLYMISNATPTAAITITLHPDAFARLADDADVVAALEVQPLVSLVSA